MGAAVLADSGEGQSRLGDMSNWQVCAVVAVVVARVCTCKTQNFSFQVGDRAAVRKEMAFVSLVHGLSASGS